jgi:baseplate J-like protein
MPTEPAIADYTNRDYSSLLASLLDLAALKLPEWTDRAENDLGRLFLELFAHVGDTILYYQDRVAAEAFLQTAVERRSVIDLLSLIGYTLAAPAPAAVKLKITAPDDATTPVTVSDGARFATRPAPGLPEIEFIYLPVSGTPLQIPRTGADGQVTSEITVVNAQRIQDEPVGTSSGEANQVFRLKQRPVILPRDADSQEGIRVEVDPGGAAGGFERWEKRGTLLYSLSKDPHFVVRVEESDEAQIVFGDGLYGHVPPQGSAIRATYLVGGGEIGNVGPDTITVVKSGVNVPVTVTNPAPASGGADRESIDHARRNAPKVYRSLDRAVTAQDYAALAQNHPGVARAAAVAPSWNYVDLYVVASGGLTLTDDLRARLLRYFESRRMLTTIVAVREPVFVSLNLRVEIGAEPTSYRLDVRRRTEEALRAIFEIDRIDFGQTFYLSKIYEAVEAVDGVAFARVPSDGFRGFRSQPPGEEVDPAAAATGLIQLHDREFPRLGVLTVQATGGL